MAEHLICNKVAFAVIETWPRKTFQINKKYLEKDLWMWCNYYCETKLVSPNNVKKIWLKILNGYGSPLILFMLNI